MQTAELSEPIVDSPIHSAAEALLNYCRDNNWAGWDPFDGLNSPLFRIPLFQGRWPRLVFIQGFKRSPINLRRLFGVPKEHNPKGLALFAGAAIKLQSVGLSSDQEARKLLELLIAARSGGKKQTCWGYNFDWQTRYYLVPRFTPNIICTTFAGNTLIDAFEKYSDAGFLEHAISAGRFLLEGLNRTGSDTSFCFSYTPLDKSQIHNANLLGAAFLARLFAHTGIEEFRLQALAATQYSTALMREDGSWPYGEGPRQAWIDSFHTGYNLVALQMIQQSIPGANVEEALQKGYSYFLEHFLNDDGSVKYYHNETYPIDAHAQAQGVLTLIQLRDRCADPLSRARRILDWTNANMRSPEGWFYYQEHKNWTNRIPYIRWCQAWMLIALAGYLEVDRRR
jgi:hypothetical protein